MSAIISNKQQVLRVDYIVTEQFRIPQGIDLNDSSQVKSYCVKYNKLFISFVDDSKEDIEVEPEFNQPRHFDWKHPKQDSYEIDEESGEDDN